MEKKIYELPYEHVVWGDLKIVVAKFEDDQWYVIYDEENALPLPSVKQPCSPKRIYNAIKKDYGERELSYFFMNHYSRVKLENLDSILEKLEAKYIEKKKDYSNIEKKLNYGIEATPVYHVDEGDSSWKKP